VAGRPALVIVNPAAGAAHRRTELESVLELLHEAGWDVRAEHTRERGHATSLARRAVDESHAALFVAGGDGTLNEVIQSLAGTAVALGPIPFGTMNVWVREVGMSADPLDVARELVSGECRRVDLGRANGRYFLLMAGLGMDAEAVHAIQGAPKRHFGPVALTIAGTLAALRGGGTRLRIRADGRSFSTSSGQVTVGNTRRWAGAFELAHRASAGDGMLDLCSFAGRNLFGKLRHFLLVITRQQWRDPDVLYLRAREILLAARPPMPLQVDGEPAGSTPVRFEAIPRALTVMVGRRDPECLAGAPRLPLP
jgi:YegS/Rv2252/BmrU family lipid kinase